MFLKQAFALVALLATTGILAAPSPYENKDSEGPKGVKGYDFDHKGYDFDHKGIEYRGNHKPAYPYNFCGWGYKYYDHEKECRVERCPSGKAFWDKEKKCNDKPKCYFGHYWDENECDCKEARKCSDKPGTEWDDVKQECRKPHYHDDKKCGKGKEWDDAGKKCKKYSGNCGPYMDWDAECKACVAWGQGFDYSG